MTQTKKKLIRITTIPASLGGLLTGQLHFMADKYDVLGISSRQNGLLQRVGAKEKIRVSAVEMTRSITPFKDLLAVWKLYRILRKEKPFIVHSHTPKAGTLGMLAAYLAGVPHRLHTIAGLPLLVVKGPKRKLLNLVEKMTYACATTIYPNSFGLKEIILQQKFTVARKLKVIGHGSSNGIDTTFFAPDQVSQEHMRSLKEKFDIGPTDFVFIFLGRLVKDKGINELIAAFVRLNAKTKNTKLLLLGKFEPEFDPVLPKTQKAIAEHDDIIFVGWQTEVRDFFALADVLTFPSYREGFPNTVMQAAALEIPCIVSDINGCNEIIEHNKNGIIIPVADVDALYNAMKKTLTMDKADLRKMAKASRQTMVEKYERRFVWEELLKEYKSLEIQC